MTIREQNAIDAAHKISHVITAEHGDVSEKMMFLFAMQYTQWQWIVEDLGLNRARTALVERSN